MSYYRKKYIRQQIEDAVLIVIAVIGACLCAWGLMSLDARVTKTALPAGVVCLVFFWLCIARMAPRSWPFATK